MTSIWKTHQWDGANLLKLQQPRHDVVNCDACLIGNICPLFGHYNYRRGLRSDLDLRIIMK